MVVEDAALSVSGGGTPITHSLGWGMGGVKAGSKQIRLYLKIGVDKTIKMLYISGVG